MRSQLKLEKGWTETVEGREIVFNFKLHATPFILIKVFSGILAGQEQSRNCGKDAIRVAAVNTRTNSGWIKSARVYRVMGWRENLKTRVCQVIADAKARLNKSVFNYPVKRIDNLSNLRAEREVWQIEGNQN